MKLGMAPQSSLRGVAYGPRHGAVDVLPGAEEPGAKSGFVTVRCNLGTAGGTQPRKGLCGQAGQHRSGAGRRSSARVSSGDRAEPARAASPGCERSSRACRGVGTEIALATRRAWHGLLMAECGVRCKRFQRARPVPMPTWPRPSAIRSCLSHHRFASWCLPSVVARARRGRLSLGIGAQGAASGPREKAK